MDGPSMQAGFAGGGFEAGSAYVSIGADLSGLEAGLAKAQSMVAGFAAQGGNVAIGGGMAGGGGTFTAAPPMPVGGMSLGGAGLPVAPTPVTAVAALPAAPSPFNVNIAQPFAPGFTPQQQPQPVPPQQQPQPVPPQPAQPSAFLNMRNLAVAYMGIAGAADIFTAEFQAEDIRQHPEQFLRPLDRLGSAFSPYSNPTLQRLSVERARFEAGARQIEGWESVPVFGGLVKMADEAGVFGETPEDRERRRQRYERIDEIESYLPEAGYRASTRLAGSTGNRVLDAELRAAHGRTTAQLDFQRVYDAGFRQGSPEYDTAHTLIAAATAQGAIDVAQAGIETQMMHEGYQSRVAVASLQAGYLPESARAQAAVERARQEVAAASPQFRRDVIRANRAELEAQATLATAQRGGEVAVNMTMAQAAGDLSTMGYDLSGRDRDRLGAQAKYRQGADSLDNVPQAATDKIVEAIKEIGKKFNPVAVTMFAPK